MTSERNPYDVSQASASASASNVTSFGLPMTLALALPILLVIGAWIVQWLFRFSPLSTGGGLTANALVIGLVAEVISVPIAVVRLVRNPHLRSGGSIALTSLASLLMLFGLLLVAALLRLA